MPHVPVGCASYLSHLGPEHMLTNAQLSGVSPALPCCFLLEHAQRLQLHIWLKPLHPHDDEAEQALYDLVYT